MAARRYQRQVSTACAFAAGRFRGWEDGLHVRGQKVSASVREACLRQKVSGSDWDGLRARGQKVSGSGEDCLRLLDLVAGAPGQVAT